MTDAVKTKAPLFSEKQGRFRKWLPDKDSNLNKQSQNLLCYHYTIGQWENRSGERRKPGGGAS